HAEPKRPDLSDFKSERLSELVMPLDRLQQGKLGALSTMAQTQQSFPTYPPDSPLRLAVAAKAAFPDGSMTASGLRREAQRGRLVVERIAGKDYTTLANIERMRELCRVQAKVRDCGSEHAAAAQRSGSSEMGITKRAQDVLHTILLEPKKP